MDLHLDDLPMGLQMRLLRVAAGLTAKDMAARWGKSEAYISRVETGKTAPKPLEIKDAIEAAGAAVVGVVSREGVLVRPPPGPPARTT